MRRRPDVLPFGRRNGLRARRGLSHFLAAARPPSRRIAGARKLPISGTFSGSNILESCRRWCQRHQDGIIQAKAIFWVWKIDVVFGKLLRILGQAERLSQPPDLTLSVLDLENGKSTTRRNILQRPHKGHMSVEGVNPDFLLGGRTSASAECRHWFGRAVRWSSCAILLSVSGRVGVGGLGL
jgi:hypothetical protein